MIQSFSCRETKKIFEGFVSTKLPVDIQNTARRKLRMMNNALKLADLRVPPNNRLKALKGLRKGFYSIRINNQWRICFIWSAGNCLNVEITDYHK
jgi:proteic killer suppression protein